jgi:tripartite-type tricarboxylate transporter receptor subunit TctC
MLKTLSILIAFGLSAIATTAQAQSDWPQKPVRIIVPTAPGGSIDLLARLVAANLQQKWGQAVVVENRAGAAMRIGTDAVAKAQPDGYTILFAHDGAMAMNVAVFKQLAYDPQKDFAPIAMMASLPLALMVHQNVPVNSLQELITYARKNPGKLNHASGGTATLLALELFKAHADLDIKSVPFMGGSTTVNAVMSGTVEMLIADVSTAAPAIQSPQVKILGISTLERQKILPNVPTLDESGVKGYEVRTWIGAFAPAGTPKPILDKWEKGITEAMRSGDVRDKVEGAGLIALDSGADVMRQRVAADIRKWVTLVRERNLQFDQN